MKKDKKYRRKIEALKAQISSEKIVKKVPVISVSSSVSTKDKVAMEAVSFSYIKRDLIRTAVLTVVCFGLIGMAYFALGHLETIRGVLSRF